ncbi:FliM/FliN family flagellar motor switch protein [Acidiferrimicrobium sp. IK]|uniref:FliM/FliN family flagellar motor switch protein n=1 Tax=Acidiferrimicrobium sp. IK TaxID=2871700 RepID=UPI0021CB8AF5|nr:FliM/FliN family flagellar motor switch protein [Acidiferrimicrobium sp. IK]MCU4185019.1 FliM/FliN family flagellar motor switch protein [Acidiferrimicrobium sp. IK]
MTNAAPVVRPYNFKRQETVERSRLRHLTPVFEAVSHQVASALTSALHMAVRVEIGEIRQDSWETFASELPETTFLASGVLSPMAHRVILNLPLPVAMAFVELRLGGDGRGAAPERALTDIEQGLVDELAQAALVNLTRVFETTVPVQLSALTSVGTTTFLQVPNPSDTWLLLPLTVAPGDVVVLEAALWLPSSLVVALLDAVQRDDGGQGDLEQDGNAGLHDRLLDVPVSVTVRFPDISLSTDELLSLAPGDVIPLHCGEGAPLRLTVDGARHCDVIPTTRGRRLACTVVDPSQEN